MAEIETNPATGFLDRLVDAAGSAFSFKLLTGAQSDLLKFQFAQQQAMIDAQRQQQVQQSQASVLAGVPMPLILFGVAGLVVFLIANR